MSLDHNGNGPPASNPDSVILIMFCIMGILSTIYVIISIIKMGIIKISLARMVLILNVAVGCRNICYIPYVYRTNETCQVIGALSWYFTFIILLVIHMMMKFLAVELFQSSPPQHYLSQIFLIPIIPTIIPVSLNVYDTKWQFCDMRRGEYIIPEIIMNILSWSLLAVIYYELYLVIKKLLSISLDLYNLLQKKLFGGPGIYAVVAAFFSLIMTFSTLCSFLLGNEMDASHYYLRVYFPAMFSFVSSIVYAIIFYWQSHFFEVLILSFYKYIYINFTYLLL
jgi:hypothetical protein